MLKIALIKDCLPIFLNRARGIGNVASIFLFKTIFSLLRSMFEGVPRPLVPRYLRI